MKEQYHVLVSSFLSRFGISYFYYLRKSASQIKCFKKLKNCYGEYVLKTSLRDFLKTASRRLEDQQMFDGVLIYCNACLCNAVFMSINCNIYPAVLSVIFCSILFIYTYSNFPFINRSSNLPSRTGSS